MSFKQEKVINTSLKKMLVDSLIDFFFENKCLLFGGCVRDYIISKTKIYPNDFDIGVDNINNIKDEFTNRLGYCYEISCYDIKKNTTVIHSNMQLIYKYKTKGELIKFTIDISPKTIIGSNLDIDVNGIYMSDRQSFHLMKIIKNVSLIDIINKINKKKFTILKTFNPPVGSRTQIGIEKSSHDLLEFIKIMERTVKMMCRGWKLDGDLTATFNPLLIKQIDKSIDETKCNICDTSFKKYEMELNCCKKIICFSCAVNHIKSKYGNSEICCPYCRGDPFGWKTTKLNNNANLEFIVNDGAINQSNDDSLPSLIPALGAYDDIPMIPNNEIGTFEDGGW